MFRVLRRFEELVEEFFEEVGGDLGAVFGGGTDIVDGGNLCQEGEAGLGDSGGVDAGAVERGFCLDAAEG